MKLLLGVAAGVASLFAGYMVFRPKDVRQNDINKIRSSARNAWKSASNYTSSLFHTEKSEPGSAGQTSSATA